ncbi:hypothetical protein [Streptomyces sp. B6B3]|uniref:hypothetical protein n=1 Tax=Streptomyces sp. B6B3 TaxID=3153570 RepID=UPI00325D21A2
MTGTNRRQPLSLAQVARMPSWDLKPLWQADFHVLVTTAIADAEGRTRPSVAAGLRSSEWCEDWLDALNCAAGDLETAVERMTYTHDPRLDVTDHRLRCVRAALCEARTLHKRRHQYLTVTELERRRQYRADLVALRWLRNHHREEANTLRRTLLAQAGLPAHPPGWGNDVADGVEVIEQAAENGLLHAPRPPAVDDLLDLSDRAFRARVSDDVCTQNQRITALRHPAMLNDWMAALQELADKTTPTARVDDRNLMLAPLDYHELSVMAAPDVYRIIRARRFYRGVEQRMAEWRHLVQRLIRDAQAAEQRAAQPWSDIEQRVRQHIAERHPRQYAAVRRALAPFGTYPGAADLDPDRFTRKVRGELKHMLMTALDDGTWKQLLLET